VASKLSMNVHTKKLQIEADCCLQVEQEERERLEGQCKVRLWITENEMRDAFQQIFYLCNNDLNVSPKNAITRRGDH